MRWMPDASLIIITGLLLDHAKRSPVSYPAPFVRERRKELDDGVFVGGAYDMELDRHFPGPEGRSLLLRLLSSAIDDLRSRRGVVSAEELTELTGRPTAVFVFRDTPVEHLIELLGKVEGVVSGAEIEA